MLYDYADLKHKLKRRYSNEKENSISGHCVAHVKEVLEALENTTDIQVDLGTQSVLVETGVTDELIRQAIDEAGYTVLGID